MKSFLDKKCLFLRDMEPLKEQDKLDRFSIIFLCGDTTFVTSFFGYIKPILKSGLL